MTETFRSADVEHDAGEFEPFAHVWVADDGGSAAHRARAWAEERMAIRDILLDAFRVGDDGDPESMPTLPMPHPADLVVVGVSDAESRRRARGLVTLFGCSVAIVPEDAAPGSGIVCGVDRLSDAGMTAAAAGAEAEHAGAPLLLVHAVAARFEPFSTREGRTDPALRIGRATVERHHPTVELSSRVRSTAAAHALLDESRGRELLVVGGERISSPASVLGELIDRTAIPLLVARGGGSSRLRE